MRINLFKIDWSKIENYKRILSLIKSPILIFLLLLVNTQMDAQVYSDSISINFFMLDECIISQNISGSINNIHKEFEGNKSLHFQIYFPNFSTKPEKMEAFIEKYKLESIPYKSDYFKTKATKYGATVCPEVVVYDEKMNHLIYRGRINNSYDKIGSRRRVITKNDLYDVLNSILENKKIEEYEHPAIGCFINFKELN